MLTPKFSKVVLIGLLLVSIIPAKSQNSKPSTQDKWNTIDSLIVIANQPKTALQLVNQQYNLAKKTNETTLLIKTLLYKLELQQRIEENATTNYINLLQADIKQQNQPIAKSLLNILLARAYHKYYNNNQWQIDERKATTETKGNDITVWNRDHFKEAISKAYEQALMHKTLLQTTSLKSINELIIYGNTAKLRPTLFDIVAQEAIAYYASTHYVRNSRSYASEDEPIDDESILLPLPKFLTHKIKGMYNGVQALQLLQQVAQFHLQEKNFEALIDVDLQRINWSYRNSASENKGELFVNALQYITQQYPNQAQCSQAHFYVAEYYKELGDNFKQTKSEWNKNGYVKAIEIIKNRLANFKDSCIGNTNLKNLLASLVQPKINAQIEAVNIPNKPFRVLLNYQNCNQIYYRIIKLKHDVVSEDEDGNLESRSNDDEFWQAAIKHKWVIEEKLNLPVFTDYQNHKVEVKINALPVGRYAIIASNNANYSIEESRLFYLPFTVSNLGVIQNETHFFVVNRDEGNLIANATVTVKENKYNYEKRKNIKRLITQTISNQNGEFVVNDLVNHNYRTLEFLIAHKGDTIQNSFYTYINRSINNDTRNEKEIIKDNAYAHFFLDRSIYRPGQTLKFKGIITTKSKNEEAYRLYKELKKVTVQLTDVNGLVVDSSSFELNDFGSFNGEFILPKNRLTGQFSLSTIIISGNKNFSVEEYKRPTFYIHFDTLKTAYKLNDSITIKGKALAYAGNAITNAKLRFVVKRNTRFIYDWCFWRMPNFNSNDKQISNGEIKTNAKGEFEFNFKAEPDKSVDKNTQPFFDYAVDVTITDEKGETRENNTNVSVGYQSTIINAIAPKKMDANNLQPFALSTTNTNNTLVKKQVHLKCYQLQVEQRLLRQRFWEMPDTFLYTKADYIKNFPNDIYANEDQPFNWEKIKLVNEEYVTTTLSPTQNKYTPNKQLLQNGNVYLFEFVVKEDDGTEVKTMQLIEINEEDKNTQPKYNLSNFSKAAYAVNDTAQLTIKTNASSIYLIQNTKQENAKKVEANEQHHFSFSNLTNNQSVKINHPIVNNKAIGLFYAFAKNNRFFKGGENVVIKQPNKNLQIGLGTYRNKTLPGAKETYSLTIKGENNEPKASELLTAMYDASLDQFTPHSWTKPIFNEQVSMTNSFKFFGNNILSSTNNNNEIYFDEETIFYDRLVDDIEILSENNYNERGRKLYPKIFKKLYTLKIGTINQKGSKDVSIVYNLDGNAMSVNKGDGKSYFTSPKIVKDAEVRDEGNPMLVSLNGDGVDEKFGTKPQTQQPTPQPRKNFNETAFFIPNVYANDSGKYEFSVTLPESLTQWNWLSLAHTKNLEIGLNRATITTQKPLMVQPNLPRFFRQGDAMELAVKIANTDTAELTGSCTLELIDAITGNAVDGWFANVFPNQYFTADAMGNAIVKFPLQIPNNAINPLTIRISAKTTKGVGSWNFIQDAEENTIVILSNKILVTETLPLFVKANDKSKTFFFKKLDELIKATTSGVSNSKGYQPTILNATVEYMANPTWAVVQALPYLTNYPYDCAEQTFNKFFANALSASIVARNPSIKTVVNKWQQVNEAKENKFVTKGWGALNEDLKNVLLQETPWVAQAKNESEQQENIAKLFNVSLMAEQVQSTIKLLQEKQKPSGGFAWFDGGREDVYITQYIVAGFGKLLKINALPKEIKAQVNDMLQKAILFIDREANTNYKRYVEELKKVKNKKEWAVAPTDLHYWYARSFFANQFTESFPVAYFEFTQKQLATNWNSYSNYQKGLWALALHRLPANASNKKLSIQIVKSLVENAVEDTLTGTMYWKTERNNYYWHNNNFEAYTLLIEAINEITKEMAVVESLKTWLLLNKETNQWESTVATASACYALLSFGNATIKTVNNTTISLGAETVSTKNQLSSLGYIKQTIPAEKLNANSSTINILKAQPNDSVPNVASYGAVYVQSLQHINAIEADNDAPFSLAKKLYIEKNINGKVVLVPIADNEELTIGDKLIVQLTLKSNKNMNYVHVKDMRACATEPTNVLSSYKWQDGLGYYESTKDAATNFFIDYLPKGTYVFTYPLFVTHTGTFSIGIASTQCMYAPKYASHTEGSNLRVK